MSIDIPKLNSYTEVLEYLDVHGVRYNKLAKDWRKNWVIYAGLSRDICITAGSHGDEYAGVLSTVALAIEDIGQCIIPFRDPSGLISFSENLKFLTDYEGDIRTSEDVFRVIRNHADWVFESNKFIIGAFWNIAVSYMPPQDDWSGENVINQKLQEFINTYDHVKEHLEGLRVLIPPNLPKSDGIGELGRTFTSFVLDGKVYNFNSMFHIEDVEKLPEEFVAVKTFLENLKPRYVLDLHEGYGSKFYQYIPLDASRKDKQITLARIAIDGVKNSGFEVSTVLELKELKGSPTNFVYGEDDADAIVIMEDGLGKTLVGFAFHKLGSLSSTFETGLKAPLIKRVLSHYYAVLNVLDKLEELI
ncbi:MAG: hypothetical protein ACP6IP_08360 [Candidatus Njordarchaeia archaeon]